MLEDVRLYLKKKAQDLDLDRADVLVAIQALLDKNYPAKTKAKSLNAGVLKIITSSAAVASELRLRQAELIKQFTETTTRPIERLNIQITDLS